MVFMRAVRVPGRDRLGNGSGCAPSLPKMAHIPGKDGAHPGAGLILSHAAIVRHGGNVYICSEYEL